MARELLPNKHGQDPKHLVLKQTMRVLKLFEWQLIGKNIKDDTIYGWVISMPYLTTHTQEPLNQVHEGTKTNSDQDRG